MNGASLVNGERLSYAAWSSSKELCEWVLNNPSDASLLGDIQDAIDNLTKARNCIAAHQARAAE
jgi:hypothetical protein